MLHSDSLPGCSPAMPPIGWWRRPRSGIPTLPTRTKFRSRSSVSPSTPRRRKPSKLSNQVTHRLCVYVWMFVLRVCVFRGSFTAAVPRNSFHGEFHRYWTMKMLMTMMMTIFVRVCVVLFECSCRETRIELAGSVPSAHSTQAAQRTRRHTY